MTLQGASKIREAGSTYETVRKLGESLGCKPVNVLACFGQYDYVGIWECPNEVAALKLAVVRRQVATSRSRHYRPAEDEPKSVQKADQWNAAGISFSSRQGRSPGQ